LEPGRHALAAKGVPTGRKMLERDVRVPFVRLTRPEQKIIEQLKGDELRFRDWGFVGVEYPYVWYNGEKIRLNTAEWRELLDGYFKSPDNEGYWLMAEARKEFGGSDVKDAGKKIKEKVFGKE
jgi:hypothetical protein